MLIRIFFCAVLALSGCSVMAQRNNGEVLIQTQSMATAGIQRVEADADAGNISMEGVNAADARVEVYAWSRKDEKETRQLYKEFYDVTITTKNGTLIISSKRKNRQRDQDISVSFRVFVPVSASGDLMTNGGNIHCARLSGGTQKVMTKGGNIAFEDLKGQLSGNTSGGNISVVRCAEKVDMRTSGGNIHARQTEGQLTLFTSGGNISLEELSGTIKAETSGGNVGAERVNGILTTSTSGGNLGLQDLSCALDASTNGGNIDASIVKLVQYVKLGNHGSGHTHLRLPGAAGFDIDANGHSVKINPEENFKGNRSDKEWKGSVNGGGIPVTIDGGDSKVVVDVR